MSFGQEMFTHYMHVAIAGMRSYTIDGMGYMHQISFVKNYASQARQPKSWDTITAGSPNVRNIVGLGFIQRNSDLPGKIAIPSYIIALTVAKTNYNFYVMLNAVRCINGFLCFFYIRLKFKVSEVKNYVAARLFVVLRQRLYRTW